MTASSSIPRCRISRRSTSRPSRRCASPSCSPTFRQDVRPGDLVVAGRNFGHHSHRACLRRDEGIRDRRRDRRIVRLRLHPQGAQRRAADGGVPGRRRHRRRRGTSSRSTSRPALVRNHASGAVAAGASVLRPHDRGLAGRQPRSGAMRRRLLGTPGSPICMQYDPRSEPHNLAHDPVTSLVVPRPIGWISTISPTGIVNLAPYSFFNLVPGKPPFVMFSSNPRKHSQRNAETDRRVRVQPRDLRPARPR